MIQSRLPRWPDRDKVPEVSYLPSRIHPEDLNQSLISTVEGFTLIHVDYRAWLEEKSSPVASEENRRKFRADLRATRKGLHGYSHIAVGFCSKHGWFENRITFGCSECQPIIDHRKANVASAQKSCIEFHHREPLWRRVWRSIHG